MIVYPPPGATARIGKKYEREAMRKLLLAGIAIAMMATPAFAQSYRFVIVPKAMNNPFFDFARDGCEKRAKELGNIECIYKGPVEHEPATQAQIIQDFVTQKVDGLAISVADVAAMSKSIEAATAAGIPVITFDSDAPGSKRIAYIGTNNKEFGVALGKQLLKLRPDGGKYAMVSGGPGAEIWLNASMASAKRLKVRNGPRCRARRPSATTTPRLPCSR